MGDDEMVEFLLNECGANPNAGSRNPFDASKVRQKNEGNMPLMIASFFTKEEWSPRRERIVQLLLAHEAISVNQQDANGFTALIKACTNGNAKCRNILLDAGVDTRIVDIDGKNYMDHSNECLLYGPLKLRNGKRRK
jgi:ankyrin repeat protein